MSFISQGDYLFPFTFTAYWIKHVYTWSYQTGAANLDGIMRLPSRLINIFVFGLTGNVGVSYFYIFFSVAIIFGAFYLFTLHFLDIKDWRIRLLSSAFFALNPIFLGYIAKIGLLVGVAMLPLCLVVLRQAFLKRQFRYLILFLLLLNVSLVHPFTFTINVVVSGLYIFTNLRTYGSLFTKHKFKTAGLVVLGIVLNLYFLLPIAGLGTVSKSALSEEISTGSVDYTSLVDFANAGNPLTALSLSRDVLLDFRYYNFSYEPVYFAAVFVFYVILFGLYIHNEKQLGKLQRSRLLLLFGLFLLLILLSMATFFGLNILLKMLIGLPGGWAFRSPLKWQLYIPLVLATILSLLLAQTKSRHIRTLAMVGIATTLALMSVFLSVDIQRKLLTPKQFQYLGGLQGIDLEHKNVLFVSDAACFSFMQENLGVVTEMNQIFTSKNTQLKRIKSADVDTINLGSYDYVLGCSQALTPVMQQEPRFAKSAEYVDKVMALYQNQKPRPYIYPIDHLISLDKPQNVANKSSFISQVTGKDFDFVANASNKPVVTLYDPFEGLTTENIQDDKILGKIFPGQNVQTNLYIQPQNNTIFGKSEGNRLTFRSQPETGFKPTKPGSYTLQGTLNNGLEFAYQDGVKNRSNLIANPSFEQGLWQKSVWDCYAYDDRPRISMALNTKEKVSGQNSLELQSVSHIACSGPAAIKVKDTSRYLLTFRYLAGKGTAGGYGIGFDDPADSSISDRLAGNGEWQYFVREVEVPKGARSLQLTAQAYPGNSGVQSKVLFDDFGLIEIPDVQGKFYAVTQPNTPLQAPTISHKDLGPTKKTVTVTGAKSGFYVAMRDTFHPKWQLGLQAGRLKKSPRIVSADNHLKLNGFMNGWYVDPTELCKGNPAGCTQNADGTYTIQLVAEFTLQRWFYLGLAGTGVAMAGVAVYFGYLGVMAVKRGDKRYWRWH